VIAFNLDPTAWMIGSADDHFVPLQEYLGLPSMDVLLQGPARPENYRR